VAEDVAESEIEAVADAVAVEEVASEGIESPGTGGTVAAEGAPTPEVDGGPAGEAPA